MERKNNIIMYSERMIVFRDTVFRAKIILITFVCCECEQRAVSC